MRFTVCYFGGLCQFCVLLCSFVLCGFCVMLWFCVVASSVGREFGLSLWVGCLIWGLLLVRFVAASGFGGCLIGV